MTEAPIDWRGPIGLTLLALGIVWLNVLLLIGAGLLLLRVAGLGTPAGLRLLGPTFRWELRRIAWTKDVWFCRALFIVGIVVVIGWFVVEYFHAPNKVGQHDVLRRGALTLMGGQALVLTGLAFWLLFNVFGDEQRALTWDELYVTDLEPHELLLSKGVARLAFVSSLWLVSWPFLIWLPALGASSWVEIGAYHTAILAAMLAAAGVGCVCAVVKEYESYRHWQLPLNPPEWVWIIIYPICIVETLIFFHHDLFNFLAGQVFWLLWQPVAETGRVANPFWLADRITTLELSGCPHDVAVVDVISKSVRVYLLLALGSLAWSIGHFSAGRRAKRFTEAPLPTVVRPGERHSISVPSDWWRPPVSDWPLWWYLRYILEQSHLSAHDRQGDAAGRIFMRVWLIVIAVLLSGLTIHFWFVYNPEYQLVFPYLSFSLLGFVWLLGWGLTSHCLAWAGSRRACADLLLTPMSAREIIVQYLAYTHYLSPSLIPCWLILAVSYFLIDPIQCLLLLPVVAVGVIHIGSGAAHGIRRAVQLWPPAGHLTLWAVDVALVIGVVISLLSLLGNPSLSAGGLLGTGVLAGLWPPGALVLLVAGPLDAPWTTWVCLDAGLLVGASVNAGLAWYQFGAACRVMETQRECFWALR